MLRLTVIEDVTPLYSMRHTRYHHHIEVDEYRHQKTHEVADHALSVTGVSVCNSNQLLMLRAGRTRC